MALLYCITHNQAATSLKKRARRREKRLEDVAAPCSVDPEREALDRMCFAEAEQAIDGLTQLERQVRSQRFAGELSIAETATIMNCSLGAVKFLQYTALQAERRKLEGQGAGSRGG